MSQSPIPKLMRHVWVGPAPAPKEWMQTWIDLHPDWEYHLFDNADLERTTFRTRHLIDRYMSLRLYAGAADLIRYELLFADGGFMVEADSVCLRPIDELLTKPACYTVYENEFCRGKLVMPIIACEPGNAFVGKLIETLEKLSPDDLGIPWKTTGNLFLAKMVEEYGDDVVIFPSYMFNPIHFDGIVYQGDQPSYAYHMFGTTREIYPGSTERRLRYHAGRVERAVRRLLDRVTNRDYYRMEIEFYRRNTAAQKKNYDNAIAGLLKRNSPEG